MKLLFIILGILFHISAFSKEKDINTCCATGIFACDGLTKNLVCNNFGVSECKCRDFPEITKTIDRPKNSVINDSVVGWSCKKGHVQRRDECLDLFIPENATLDQNGHTWSCNEGFRMYRNRCKKIKLPKNAVISGNGWVCKEGHKRYKRKCVKKY